MVNIFEDKDPYPGASGPVRRSLSQLELTHPSLRRIIDAANSLGVKFESPAWVNPDVEHGAAVAHISFPKHKTAVLTQHVRDNKRIALFREAWEARGWKSVCVLRGDIERTSAAKLADDLAEILRVKRGRRK